MIQNENQLLLILIGLGVNIAISYSVSILGAQRRIGSVGAFVASFFLSPLIGLLFVIASIPLSNEELLDKTREKEKIKDEELLFPLSKQEKELLEKKK